MLVVSDTTPLNYLVLIEVVQVLPELFGSILVPAQVIKELLHEDTSFRSGVGRKPSLLGDCERRRRVAVSASGSW